MRNQKNTTKFIELLLESHRIPVWGLALLMSQCLWSSPSMNVSENEYKGSSHTRQTAQVATSRLARSRLPCPWTLLDRFGRLYTTNSLQANVVALSHLIGVASSSVSYILPGILPVYIVKYIACIYCQVYCQQQYVSWLWNTFSSSKSCLQAKSTDLVGMPHFLTWSSNHRER